MLNRFGNLSIRAKLLCGFGVSGLLLILIGSMSLVGMHRLSESTEFIYKTNLIPVTVLSDLRAAMLRRTNFVIWHILANDSATMTTREKSISELDKVIEDLLAKYAPVIVTESERKLFEQFKTGEPEYLEARQKVLQLSRNFSKDAAIEVQNTELVKKLGVLYGAVDGLMEENKKQAEESYVGSNDLSTSLNWIMIVLNICALFIGAFTVWFVSKLISENLLNVLEAAHQLQNGHLTHRSTVTTEDEIGKLAKAFNQMAVSLEQACDQTHRALETQAAEIKGVTNAISKAQAVIEFNLDGTVIDANENFQRTLGYRLEEIKGQHHRMFCDPAYTSRPEYVAFWAKLGRGEYESGAYCRRRKDGQELWFQASYNPILDATGKPYKVVKYATDITAQKLAAIESEGILRAVDRGQAMIEFNMDGTIRAANTIFLSALGYQLDEVKGRHHRMFCEPAFASSGDYTAFWQKLNRGDFDTGVYKRIGKGGKEIWIQATYNPIFDLRGTPYKVVKFATDITAQKQAQEEMRQLVTEAQAVLGNLAANDLRQEMTGTYLGELDKVKASINTVVQNLTQTIATVRGAVESVASGADQITKGNEDLAQRTSEQAGSLEETSASMEEMTSTVKQNADNAKQANQLAAAARETADKGGTVTKRAVDAMGEINQSSKKIADIITVIDEIAFQTNLLALNAAVEAARAGEHGRGFAVVAAEVRNLAQRSATAAKEIKGLINESIQRVTDGSELVDQSGKTLEEIVHSVKRVSDIIAEITAASQEQASGIDQVNKAIMAMDETTQQNAALVEETTSASQSMKEQAKELMRQVGVFQITAAGGNIAGGGALPGGRPAAGGPLPKTGSASKPTRKQEPVGISSSHGKGRASSNDEFEEF